MLRNFTHKTIADVEKIYADFEQFVVARLHPRGLGRAKGRDPRWRRLAYRFRTFVDRASTAESSAGRRGLARHASIPAAKNSSRVSARV